MTGQQQGTTEREYRVPMGKAEMSFLLTLQEYQPATAHLLALAQDYSHGRTSDLLRELLRAGLVARRMHKPRPATDEERASLYFRPDTAGKPPFRYFLTAKGRHAARGLRIASRALARTGT